MGKSKVAQLVLDIGYMDNEELDSFVKAIHKLNDNSEFKIVIPDQPVTLNDMTEHYQNNPDYKKMDEILG